MTKGLILVVEDDPVTRELLKDILSRRNVIVLPEQNTRTTAVVAERLRKDIETMSIENAGSDRGIITVSCGVSAFDKDCIDSKWGTVLKGADDALYAAKSAGRNRVVSSGGH